MKGKTRILACLALPFAIGLLFWWHWAGRTVLRIRDYQTGKIYVEYPAGPGDRLFFGWIHSLEHIHWHEYFHVAPDNTLVLDTISFPAFGELRLLCFRHLLLGIQELKYPLGRSHGGLHDVGNVGYLVDGLGELAQILDKGLYHTDAQPAVDAEPSADNRHPHITDVGQGLC